jgi:catechol 2,3-dioxygenase-like lactoylglutathione lyase family enzyme
MHPATAEASRLFPRSPIDDGGRPVDGGPRIEPMVHLDQTIPALPVRDAAAAVDFYRDRLGFEALHHDGGFAVLRRDEAVLHLWEASDESWRERASLDRPVQSGAESFIAGTASCRVRTEGIDELYEELRKSGVLHPVSRDGVDDTDYGTREFATIDLDGNLVTFFRWS